MRSVINISLPESLAKEVKAQVKEGKFASTSEFVRHLIRLWNTQKLAIELKREKEEFRKGNYKVLKSISSLD